MRKAMLELSQGDLRQRPDIEFQLEKYFGGYGYNSESMFGLH
jgi:hypothetical protein